MHRYLRWLSRSGLECEAPDRERCTTGPLYPARFSADTPTRCRSDFFGTCMDAKFGGSIFCRTTPQLHIYDFHVLRTFHNAPPSPQLGRTFIAELLHYHAGRALQNRLVFVLSSWIISIVFGIVYSAAFLFCFWTICLSYTLSIQQIPSLFSQKRVR